jgi:photosystem II stability/assembly factor-like uncharacterized protein
LVLYSYVTHSTLGKFSQRFFLASLILVPALQAKWQHAGPFGGSARSIAIDAQNHNTLLAGGRDSLLFRSDDGGQTWRLLPFIAGNKGTFGAVAIDPAQSGHFYAGLDTPDTIDSGVYESKDGGDTWQLLASTRGLRIESLILWAADPKTMAAGTAKGVYLSTDAGATWKQISQADNREMQDITALAFDPADSKIIYAGTPHLPWKTVDGGESWRPIHDGLIDDSDIFSIRVDPKNPKLLYASACSGIYRSENGGDLWAKLQGIPGTHRRTHIISADPRNSSIIYAGTTLGLFKSPDGGKSWHHLSSEQVNWMVFDPTDPQVLYLATEHAGILKSKDSGLTFIPVNSGFTNHSLTQITGNGKHLYASSIYEGRYGGVFASDDGGAGWTLRASEEALQGRNLNSLVAGSPAGNLLFAASEDAVLKSSDGGKTWSHLSIQPKLVRNKRPQSFGKLRINALQTLQTDKLFLFAGTDSGLFRSADAGLSWERVSGDGLTGQPVMVIYAPPRSGSRLAVRTRDGIFMSPDAGTTWQATPLPDPSYYLYDIALSADPNAPALAGTSRGVLQLVGGTHWKVAEDGVPAGTVNSVRYHPERKLEAFLVQYGKVYRSLDGGSTWQLLPSDGLESSSIRTLWVAPDIPGRIFALSAARGALFFDMPQSDVAKQGDHVVSSSK